jgi:hypothetical protein
MVFMLMFWGIGFFDMLMQNNNQMFLEQVVKKLILLIIGLAVIANAKEIVVFFVSLSKSLWDTISLSSSNGGDYALANDVAKEIRKVLDGKGVIDSIVTSLSYVLQLIFPWIIGIGANWGIKIFALNRYLEVCIVAAVSPLLFCDISNANGGFTHSAAFRGMRQVMALAIQGIVIMAGLYLCGAISKSIMGSFIDPATGRLDMSQFLDAGFALVAVAVAKLGITAKSQQIARQLVGLG